MTPYVYFIRSRKGKLLMIVNDFSFCEESAVQSKVIWRCTSKKGKCRARIHTLGDKVLCAKGLHNHPQRLVKPVKFRKPSVPKIVNINANETIFKKDTSVSIKACD